MNDLKLKEEFTLLAATAYAIEELISERSDEEADALREVARDALAALSRVESRLAHLEEGLRRLDAQAQDIIDTLDSGSEPYASSGYGYEHMGDFSRDVRPLCAAIRSLLAEIAPLARDAPNDPLAMFTSASWQCPVCDRPGDRHADRCFVLKLATVARRRLNGNRRLTEAMGRLRERALVAEAARRATWADTCPACKGYPDQKHTCGLAALLAE